MASDLKTGQRLAQSAARTRAAAKWRSSLLNSTDGKNDSAEEFDKNTTAYLRSMSADVSNAIVLATRDFNVELNDCDAALLRQAFNSLRTAYEWVFEQQRDRQGQFWRKAFLSIANQAIQNLSGFNDATADQGSSSSADSASNSTPPELQLWYLNEAALAKTPLRASLHQMHIVSDNCALIGKYPGCDVVLEQTDLTLSRLHAIVLLLPANSLRKKATVAIVYVGSINGIRVLQRETDGKCEESTRQTRRVLLLNADESAVIELTPHNKLIVQPRICLVCLELPRSVLFNPCNHFAVCHCCADQLSKCPLCRKELVTKTLGASKTSVSIQLNYFSGVASMSSGIALSYKDYGSSFGDSAW